MLRAAWLTYRMHQLEVLISAVLIAALAVSVWIVRSHLTALEIPGTCWVGEYGGPNYAQSVCKRFWDIAASEGLPARAGLALLPPILGLIFGIPIVAREIELRTTSLAWSLALHRGRWLLSRLLPMLALATVGFVVLGGVGSYLFKALEVGPISPGLPEIASHGATLVARGLMALGIAVLAGAFIGRTMPAFLIAVIVVIGWSLFGVPTVQQSMFAERAVWTDDLVNGNRGGFAPLAYLEGGDFDTSKPGVDGEPGARYDHQEFDRKRVAECGWPPEESIYNDTPAWRAWQSCAEQIPYPDDLHWDKVVPASTYPDFQLAALALDAAIGGAAFALTFPVVARRRPS